MRFEHRLAGFGSPVGTGWRRGVGVGERERERKNEGCGMRERERET